MTIKGLSRWIDKELARLKEHPHRLKIECALLFVACFVSEWVLSVDTIVTAKGLWLAAGGTSLVFEFLTFVVLFTLLDENRRRSWPRFIAAALGSACGAMVAVAVAG
jgi:FtsH-binding integral membrane protein